MKVIKQLQQGDVNIVQVNESPNKVTKIEGGVIREGETTGHAHRIVGSDFQLNTIPSLNDVLFGQIRSDDCKLTHEEHGTILLPQGDYMFSPTVEYDHFAERSRIVRD